jgi:phosphohistidine phosphatase
MKLYVLRHAVAVERGAPGFGDDSLRPLSSEGRTKMHAIAAGMRAMDLSFDLVLSSPYLRARQTAEIVVHQLGIERLLRFTEHLESGGDPQRLMREVANADGSPESILLVGHEPFLSELISVLLTGESTLGVTLKKGGLCCLTVERPRFGRCATLDWLLTPRQLRGHAK